MGQTLVFDLPITPIPAPRPRVTHHHTYMPADSANYKADVQLAAAAAMQAQGVRRAKRHEPVKLAVVFVMPIPPSITKKEAKRRADQPHTLENSDIDNLLKLVMDAMTDVVWVGDGQVHRVAASKIWAAVGEPGLVAITVSIDHDLS